MSRSPRESATLVHILRRHARERAEERAYTFLTQGEDEAEHLAWGELDLRARAFAATLAEGLDPGARVLLLCPPGLDFITAFIGCLYAGAVAVPAYPPASKRHLPRLRSIALDAAPSAVVATTATLPKIRAAASALGELDALRWLAVDEVPAELAGAWREPEISGETLAFLQYTSGSTSEPKGVMVSHGNLMHNEEVIRQGFGLDEDSVIVGWLPLYHDMGLIGNVLQPLYLGARCVLMSPVAFLQKPLRWLRAISEHRGTTAGGPNFAFELCVRKISPEERAELDLSSWTLAYSGAEPVRAETLDSFARAFAASGFLRQAFYPCYGLAEATLMVSGGSKSKPPVMETFDAAQLERHLARPADGAVGQLLVGCGRAHHGNEVRIVEPESRRPAADDQVGEIWFAGGSVAQGYWRREEATENEFHARIAGEEESGPYLRTGDLGFVKNGELYVTGRLKDLVIVRGRNHYPQDLELTAERAHDSLRPGCGAAFAVDLEGEERLVLVFEIDRHPKGEPEVIADAVRRAVAEAHEVQVYEVVLIRTGTVHKTSSGKIQRLATKRSYLAGELRVIASSSLATESIETALGSEIELDRAGLLAQRKEERAALLTNHLRELAARLCRVAASSLEADQPLSALGLDSLAAIELKSRIEGDFAVALDLAQLLEGATLAEISAAILEGLERPAPEAFQTSGEVPAEHPLSHGQRALWYLYRHSPDSSAYNIVGGARIHGHLDAEALECAWQRLVRRHPALHTIFGEAEGELLARVCDDLDGEFHFEDAEHWSPEELDARLLQEVERPFDLENGPLVRLAVFRAAPRLHRVVLAVHHVAADFWSLGIVLAELGELYRAEAGGEPPRLEPPAASYADFVAREKALIEGPEGERQWNYWRERLSGELPILDLPTDRPRPRVQTFDGLSKALRLGGELPERLREHAQARGVTLYMLLLASFQTFLRRAGGQEEILVGSPSALRGGAGTAQLVGYLVNPLALRGDLRGNPPFDHFLDRVRSEVLGAFAHQSFPFPLAVERLAPPHDPSRSPIFQAMFVWQRDRPDDEGLAGFALGEAGVRLELGGLDLESDRLEQRSAQFDVTLTMAEVGGEIWASLQLNRDLFDAATAERWAGHLETLLEGIVRAPKKRLAELPLLTESERRELLEAWNPPAEPGEAACLHELFAVQAAAHPEAEALVVGEARITYRELDRASNALAHRLRELGVGPEVPVGLCTERSAAMVVGILGVHKAGGAYLPLDPDYPPQRLEFSLEDSRVPVLLIHGERPENLPETEAREVDLAAFEPGSAEGADTPPSGGARPDNLSHLIYTSGSTGKPKGVAITHRSAATMVRWAAEVFGPEARSGVLASTSICFDLSVFELFLPLATGGRVILASNALELPELPAANEVTLVNTVPSAISELAESLPPKAATICLAGEPLARELVERLYAQPGVEAVYNLYGPSEDTTYSTFARVGEEDPFPPIGRPVAKTQVYLANNYLRLVPAGKPGELLLAGAGLARGYLGHPALTAERFIPDPWSPKPGRRLYRTSDLARHRRDGVLEFLGRLDHQVKVRGFRVELGEIETVLLEHEAVAEAVAVALGEIADRYLVAYVVAAEGHEAPSAQALRDHLARELPAFMVPSVFVPLEALPLTPNGKLDRKALPVPDRESAAVAAEFVAPETEVEKMLAEIWCEVLEVERVGIYDSFFDLGGQSLKATRVLSAVRELFHVDLPVRALLEAPTIYGLSQAIAKALMEGVDEETLAAVMAEME